MRAELRAHRLRVATAGGFARAACGTRVPHIARRKPPNAASVVHVFASGNSFSACRSPRRSAANSPFIFPERIGQEVAPWFWAPGCCGVDGPVPSATLDKRLTVQGQPRHEVCRLVRPMSTEIPVFAGRTCAIAPHEPYHLGLWIIHNNQRPRPDCALPTRVGPLSRARYPRTYPRFTRYSSCTDQTETINV